MRLDEWEAREEIRMIALWDAHLKEMDEARDSLNSQYLQQASGGRATLTVGSPQ